MEMQGEKQKLKPAWPLCLAVAAVLLVVWLFSLGSDAAGAAAVFGLLFALFGVLDLLVRVVRRQPLR